MRINQCATVRQYSPFRRIAVMATAVVLFAAAAPAQDTPQTELGARLAEHHGDGAFIRLEDIKLRESVAYRDAATLGALKTPSGAYQAYLSTLADIEEKAGVKTLLVNSVLKRGRKRPNCDWDIVVVKHYPNWRAWEQVEASGLRQAAYAHREAAVANDHVVVAVPVLLRATRKSRPDDPTDTMIYIMNHLEIRAKAQYADGSYPGSTGMEAYKRYRGGGSLGDTDRDIIISAEVPAALNSADAHWTRINIVRYPSLREVRRLTQPSDDPESWSKLSKHKEAAIARHCGPMTIPTLPESAVRAAETPATSIGLKELQQKREMKSSDNDLDPRVALIFSRFDADADGKLTEEESPDRLKPAFSRIDANGDGYVGKAELSAALKQFGGQ